MSSEIKVDTISENTSGNGVAIDSVTLKDGAITATTADNTDTLTLTSTDADANSGPNLRLYRNSGSPADNDLLGQIDFEGRNDNSQDVVYASILNFIDDASDGTEDSQFTIKTMKAGSLDDRLTIGSNITVFNDGSKDVDFRIQSDSQTHAFHLDSGNSKISINTSTASNYFRLHQPSADVVLYGVNENAVPYGLQIKYQNASPDGSGNTFFEGIDGSAQRFRVNSDGDVLNHDGTYGTLSDS